MAPDRASMYVRTEYADKKYAAKGAASAPLEAHFETRYAIELTSEQLKASMEEIKKCETAIRRYYEGHA